MNKKFEKESIKQDKEASKFFKEHKEVSKGYDEIVTNMFKAYGIKKTYSNIQSFIIGMQHKGLKDDQHNMLIAKLMDLRGKKRK